MRRGGVTLRFVRGRCGGACGSVAVWVALPLWCVALPLWCVALWWCCGGAVVLCRCVSLLPGYAAATPGFASTPAMGGALWQTKSSTGPTDP